MGPLQTPLLHGYLKSGSIWVNIHEQERKHLDSFMIDDKCFVLLLSYVDIGETHTQTDSKREWDLADELSDHGNTWKEIWSKYIVEELASKFGFDYDDLVLRVVVTIESLGVTA